MAISNLYRHSLSLLTDLYQLTMAYGYWKTGKSEQESIFHLYFRKNPFNGGYTVAAGLEQAIEYIRQFRFENSDIKFLKSLQGNDDRPLFENEFLDYLAELDFSIDLDAVPEGTVVFPNTPILRVRGPILQAQLLESALLNIVNFQTLIATKSARICQMAGDNPVLEFGLRRAQGIDGSISASRAAFIGGVSATSNVLAGKLLNIPVKGTHAHSWVMSFESERSAFRNYAEVMPNNSVLLVDTYETEQGIRNAIEVGRLLKAKGHRLAGIRLDSGDLAYLSNFARQMLDDAGFEDTPIIASNDLDEDVIQSLNVQQSKISVWGVGTQLVTGGNQAALGGVYKLGALKDRSGGWILKTKISEQLIKVSTPGCLQVRRFLNDGSASADMIFNELGFVGANRQDSKCTIIDPLDSSRKRTHNAEEEDWDDLLIPIMRSGELVYTNPSLIQIRDRVMHQKTLFHPSILRLSNPHSYPIGLEESLHQLKTDKVAELRNLKS
ncbi:MAG: nicotinate phosphoribosyltransferase [Planctomycetota bacterium]